MIRLIKRRFEKIIIVLELIDVFNQPGVGDSVCGRQGVREGERSPRETQP